MTIYQVYDDAILVLTTSDRLKALEKNLDIDFRLFGLQVFGVKFWDEIYFLGFWRMRI